ncbi:hypothetical protein HMPREF0454_03040 [Hafnia alvei ATCC 51873]|uniref:Uncharacterized protein n=1 Tax=Hafnia alvei ATCC 51873 TaxID=1002364 RepID=G9Y8P7_HAFAL|nr:hypothetical protein HMPREF0454_03040 [Hafnia alvei ATCC 51873]
MLISPHQGTTEKRTTIVYDSTRRANENCQRGAAYLGLNL